MTLGAVLAADPALPCRPTLRRWRRESPEFDAVLRWLLVARRGRTPVAEPWVEDIVDHIVEGGSFASYCRDGGPSRTTLRRWHRRDPAFAREVEKACEGREEWLAEQVLAAASSTQGEPVAAREQAVAALKRQVARLRHRPGTAHRKPLREEGKP